MLALSSTVVEDQKPDGVRALKPRLIDFWKASGQLVYNVHTRIVGSSYLDRVGPIEETRPLTLSIWQRIMYTWRAFRFSQSANAVNSQTVNESPAEHQNKEIGKEQSQ